MTTEERKKIMSKIKDNLKSIREVLDRKISSDDPSGAMEKLVDLIEISGLCAHTESLAKACYDSELADLLFVLAQDPDYQKLGSTAMKDITKGKCSEYLGAATYAERLGRNLSHAQDGLRSIISMHKEEMGQRKYGET